MDSVLSFIIVESIDIFWLSLKSQSRHWLGSHDSMVQIDIATLSFTTRQDVLRKESVYCRRHLLLGLRLSLEHIIRAPVWRLAARWYMLCLAQIMSVYVRGALSKRLLYSLAYSQSWKRNTHMNFSCYILIPNWSLRFIYSRSPLWKLCNLGSLQQNVQAMQATKRSCQLCQRVGMASRTYEHRLFTVQCRAASAAPEAAVTGKKEKGGKQQSQKGSKADELRVTPRSEDFSKCETTILCLSKPLFSTSMSKSGWLLLETVLPQSAPATALD